jgi:hypothetical protein
MSDKEQQIEEIEKFIYDYVDSKQTERVYLCSSRVNELAKPFVHNKGIAETFYNAGYRKLPEDRVVLSREEYDNLKLEFQKAHNKGVQAGFDMTKFKEQSIKNKARKETAEKFAEKLKKVIHERDYIQGYAEIGLIEEIDELLKEYEK